MLKTQTLSDETDNPVLVACPGHVTEEEFNQAFENEGWSSPSDYSFNDEYNPIRHEYWVTGKNEGDAWSQSTKDDPKAEPVTIVNWD